MKYSISLGKLFFLMVFDQPELGVRIKTWRCSVTVMGSLLGFPLPEIWNCLLHSGHVIFPWTPLVRWIPFRQWRQKLCKQGNCFGSVNAHMHTEQDTSSWRLASKVLISMDKMGNKITFQKVWPSPHLKLKCNVTKENL